MVDQVKEALCVYTHDLGNYILNAQLHAENLAELIEKCQKENLPIPKQMEESINSQLVSFERMVVYLDRIKDYVRGTNPSVLLVEDDPMIAELITMHLSSACLNVVYTASPQEALTYLKQKNDFVAIFTDYNLPEIRGDQFAAIARTTTEERVPIVCVTGESNISSNHVFKVLPKPFKREQLLEVVRSLTQKYQLKSDSSIRT